MFTRRSRYGLRKIKEKASPFTAGMNPTTGRQPLELSLSTAYLWVSTTGKNWRLDWGPPGRRRPPHRSREGVSEAVATRQAKSDPRPIVPAHRGTKGRQADGTARARTQGNLRLGASPLSLRDERDARCKRIPRPNGRRTRHTPRGADVSRTNPVSPRRTPFGRREVASGDVGPARCPALESSRFSAGRMSTARPAVQQTPARLLEQRGRQIKARPGGALSADRTGGVAVLYLHRTMNYTPLCESRRRDSNPRPIPYEGIALPLSYAGTRRS